MMERVWFQVNYLKMVMRAELNTIGYEKLMSFPLDQKLEFYFSGVRDGEIVSAVGEMIKDESDK